jgi:hypothetical protein
VSDNTVVIKYLPIPLALIVAALVIHVKPVEAEFCSDIYRTRRSETLSYLFTIHGTPVDPTTMTTILSSTFEEFGLHILVSDMRHALDAFAHKLAKASPWEHPSLLMTANHSVETSAAYGRGQDCISGIPASISESNAERLVQHIDCVMWHV